MGDFGGNDSNGCQSVKLTGPSRFAIGYATRHGTLHSVNGSSSPHASVRSIGPDKRACGHSRLDPRIVGKQELTWAAFVANDAVQNLPAITEVIERLRTVASVSSGTANTD